MTQIAVVGAGIAGLNAALTLQDAGLSYTIYEASHRIGGRMHSDAMTWADGMESRANTVEHTVLHRHSPASRSVQPQYFCLNFLR